MSKFFGDIWRALGSAVVALWGLDKFGDSLLTKAVRRTLISIGIGLSLQVMLDAPVWAAALYFAVEDPWIAGGGGLIFAVVLGLFDRALGLMDTSRSRWAGLGFVARIAFIVLIGGLLTSVPVELLLFKKEIGAALTMKEAVTKRYVKRDATAQIDEAFEKAIATQQQLRKDAEEVVSTRRQPGRDPLAAQLETNLTPFKERIEELDKNLRVERSGVKEAGATGVGGNGKVAKAIKADLDQARGELTEHQERNSVKLAEYDAETQRQVQLEQDRASAEIKRLTEKHQADLTALGTMSYEQMAKEHGVGAEEEVRDGKTVFLYRSVSDGFLSRWETLNELAKDSAYVRYGIWGCRLMMCVFALIVMFIKIFGGEELKIYCSLRAQAAAGQTEAIKLLESNGARSKLARLLAAYPVTMRDTVQEIWRNQRAVCVSLGKFYESAFELCQQQPPLPRHRLIHGLRKAWQAEVFDAWKLWRENREVMLLAGISPPKWEELEEDPEPGTPPTTTDDRPTLFYAEPKGRNPWELSDDQLKALGWKDPDAEAAATAPANHTQPAPRLMLVPEAAAATPQPPPEVEPIPLGNPKRAPEPSPSAAVATGPETSVPESAPTPAAIVPSEVLPPEPSGPVVAAGSPLPKDDLDFGLGEPEAPKGPTVLEFPRVEKSGSS